MTLHDIRLNSIVQGVDGRIDTAFGSFRVVILAEVLKSRFLADSSPRTWLGVTKAFENDIEAAALRANRSAKAPVVVFWSAGDL